MSNLALVYIFQQVREVPGKLGSGLVVFVWLVGGVLSRGLLTGTPRDGTLLPPEPHPPPWSWPQQGSDPVVFSMLVALESGNITRPDPTFPGTSCAPLQLGLPQDVSGDGCHCGNHATASALDGRRRAIQIWSHARRKLLGCHNRGTVVKSKVPLHTKRLPNRTLLFSN